MAEQIYGTNRCDIFAYVALKMPRAVLGTTSPCWGRGGVYLAGKAPPAPPPKRSFVTFDPGGQTGPPRSHSFLCAVDDTGAADDTGTADDTRAADDLPARHLAGRPAERPAEH